MFPNAAASSNDAAERETLRFQALRDYLAAFGENGN